MGKLSLLNRAVLKGKWDHGRRNYYSPVEPDCGIPWGVQESRATGFLLATGTYEAWRAKSGCLGNGHLYWHQGTGYPRWAGNTKRALSTNCTDEHSPFPRHVPELSCLTSSLSLSMGSVSLSFSPLKLFFPWFHPQLTAEWSHPISWFCHLYVVDSKMCISSPEHLEFQTSISSEVPDTSQFRYPTRS